MNDSEYNGFGEEEITEFTPTEFSYGDSTPSTSSAVPEEIPVEGPGSVKVFYDDEDVFEFHVRYLLSPEA